MAIDWDPNAAPREHRTGNCGAHGGLPRVAGDGAISNTHCDDLLRAPAIASLSQADRNLTTALVMGVLRWQFALDAVAARYLQRSRSWIPRWPSRCAWARGNCWDGPHSGACGSRGKRGDHQGGRPCYASGNGQCGVAPHGRRSFVDRSRSAGAHPAWMIERWTRQFGRGCRVHSIAAYDQQAPPVTCGWGRNRCAY